MAALLGLSQVIIYLPWDPGESLWRDLQCQATSVCVQHTTVWERPQLLLTKRTHLPSVQIACHSLPRRTRGGLRPPKAMELLSHCCLLVPSSLPLSSPPLSLLLFSSWPLFFLATLPQCWPHSGLDRCWTPLLLLASRFPQVTVAVGVPWAALVLEKASNDESPVWLASGGDMTLEMWDRKPSHHPGGTVSWEHWVSIPIAGDKKELSCRFWSIDHLFTFLQDQGSYLTLMVTDGHSGMHLKAQLLENRGKVRP